jgi:ubiquinone/menaquinone biosynthesis C-methylase UbiE
MSVFQTDFDRIAQLSTEDGWDHNSHYHRFLLKQLPKRVENALDIGCGTGTFSRQLAKHSRNVTGLDLSPEMIRVARERSTTYSGIRYEVADVMTYPMSENHFDCIASIGTLHHLPFEAILSRIRQALKPGGVLLVLDLFQETFDLSSIAYNALAFPLSRMVKLAKGGRDTPEARTAWEAHSKHDHFMTLSQIREISQRVLPGSILRRHLFWRYSLIWRKP